MGITWDCEQLSTQWHHPEKTLLEIASEADVKMVSACGGTVAIKRLIKPPNERKTEKTIKIR